MPSGCNPLIFRFQNRFMHFFLWLARTVQSTFTAQTLILLTYK
ncbi:hypothetical protein HMPREF0208_03084 [Citrobacter koseri]|nr:hypothetical protein HMPREF3207_04754 [Citrobacter koseri]KWZ99252.1 hypothetical protein HMPREF3220_02171 [Citrobacter koseri]KXB42859.1 hypothetical protein HMPREF0208_03084 [Citrobacter koseri]